MARNDVLVAAESVVDRLGWDGLTMAALAAETGMKVPSLYNHVASLENLRSELQQRAMRGVGVAVVASALGRSGRDALTELARALRGYVRAYPHRYEGATRAPIDRDAFFAAAGQSYEALRAVVRSFGVPEEMWLTAMLAVFSTIHGVVSLEAVGYFGDAVDLDQLFELLVSSAERQLQSLSEESK